MRAATIRPYESGDLQGVLCLVQASLPVDDAGFPLGTLELSSLVDSAAGVLVASEGTDIVGYVRLTVRHLIGYDSLYTSGVVRPDRRRRGIGTTLMLACEHVAPAYRQARPFFTQIRAREIMNGANELAICLKMQPVRRYLYMERRELAKLSEACLAGGFRIRNYQVGCDEDEFVRAYNDAFADNWGMDHRTLEKERARQASPSFRPDDTLLCLSDEGEIAGLLVLLFPTVNGVFVAGGPTLVDNLAVRPKYRRLGIARALLFAGLDRARAMGMSGAGLVVDVDNQNGALLFYESAGFAGVHRSMTYLKSVL